MLFRRRSNYTYFNIRIGLNKKTKKMSQRFKTDRSKKIISSIRRSIRNCVPPFSQIGLILFSDEKDLILFGSGAVRKLR